MRFLVWSGVEEWLTEAAEVELGRDGLRATGCHLWAEPVPFRIDYRLEAPQRCVTKEIELTTTAQGWRRHLLLRHDGSGAWRAEVEDEGDVPGGPWDGSLPDLSEARDIDIENSPLTNAMPILRHAFQTGGSGDFVMAFVTTPSLRVEALPRSAMSMSARPTPGRWSAISVATGISRPSSSSTRRAWSSSIRAWRAE
jgi:hypothetical protein